MSLSHYQKKRKFSKTPEPKGKVIKNSGPLTFVIQKHQASHLHYDFRLELDGVLKSWAVPKGPSANPDDKRLAMMVEDHPMDYAQFEGIIPKGNYGAGTVMVWDTGVYTPLATVDRDEAEKILHEQLEKGHLTFVMLGKKLQGEYALVRTPKAGENAWLLIKAGDEFATHEDILLKDHSVLTNRSIDEITKQAEKKNEIWHSKPKKLDLDDAPKTLMPHAIKPMLAHSTDEPFDKPDWFFEMKWDGFRAIAEIESGKVTLYSRNLQNFNEKFSPIPESLAKFPGNAVLDGEIVVVDTDGKPKFQWLADFPKTNKGELLYYVFDILYFDGHNLENLPLRRRKEILKQILPPLPHIAFSDHIEESGVAFFNQTAKLHLEGIIAKQADSPYIQDFRTYDWLKIKTHIYETAFIAGFTEPRGGRKHFGSLVLGIKQEGKLKYIGHVGGGFDDKSLESIYSKMKPLEQHESPFEIIPQTNTPVTWVKPTLQCEVTFTGWTEDHVMRHPVYISLKESAQNSPRIFDKNPEKTDAVELNVGEQTLKITNPAKIFWPEEGYTKMNVIEYYEKISSYILPYLKDRPESLLRHPDGISGESFFQKDVTFAPNWVKQIPIHSESADKTIHWVICNDKATLVYITSLGCIEINPWASRYNNQDYPDYLSIDLDPNGAPFEDVIRTAQITKKNYGCHRD